jgi:hypothetical protein
MAAVAVKAAATERAGVTAGNFLSRLENQNRGQRSGAPYFFVQPSGSLASHPALTQIDAEPIASHVGKIWIRYADSPFALSHEPLLKSERFQPNL